MHTKAIAVNDKGELTCAMIDGRGFIHGSVLDETVAALNAEIRQLRKALQTIGQIATERRDPEVCRIAADALGLLRNVEQSLAGKQEGK